MEHLVYISYSSKDADSAKKIVKYIESAGIKCWMAPRDILPGIDWAKSIMDGIVNSKLMLLVFSKNSNESPQVLREVERAVNHRIPIIPFRIENTPMSGSMEYFISAHHWFDAFEQPLETYLDELVIKIGKVLNIDVKLPKETPIIEQPKVKPPVVEVKEPPKEEKPIIKEEPKPTVEPVAQTVKVTQPPLSMPTKSRTGLIVGVLVAIVVLGAGAAFWFIKPLHDLIFPPDESKVILAEARRSKPCDVVVNPTYSDDITTPSTTNTRFKDNRRLNNIQNSPYKENINKNNRPIYRESDKIKSE